MRRRQFIKVFCTRKPELKFKYESLLLNVAKIVKNLFFLLSNNRERLYLFPNIRELEKFLVIGKIKNLNFANSEKKRRIRKFLF